MTRYPVELHAMPDPARTCHVPEIHCRAGADGPHNTVVGKVALFYNPQFGEVELEVETNPEIGRLRKNAFLESRAPDRERLKED